MREVRVFGATSNSVGTGDFTFNEDVSDKLLAGDEFYVIIMYDEEPTWNEGQDYRLESYIEQCEATYLGDGIFSRGTIRMSSNENERVDFPAGIKTLDVKLSSAQAIRNAQSVDISNGHVEVSNSLSVGSLITANILELNSHIAIANSTVNTGIALPTTEQYSGAYYLHANGGWAEITPTTPAGSNTYIQYNDSTVFGGSEGFTFNEATNTVSVGNTLILANSTVNTHITIPTPTEYGGAYYLHANGSWAEVIATGEGNGTPGGANTYIQYNDDGVFGGSAGFTFNETTNTVVIANTLTVGTATVNTTNYTGTANNALYLGGTAAADYQTEAGLSANVATLTANNANYLGGTAAADYQTEAGLSANVATLTANNANYVKANTGLVSNSSGVFVNSAYIGTLSANNASYLGGTAAASYALDTDLDAYQTEAGLSANVATLAANSATYVLANSGIVSNSSGVFVNSAYIGTLSANNASYLGGTAAADYALDSDLAGYQTEAGLSANVATLTANNANYLGGLAAASYANLSVANFTTSVNVGANVGLTTSQVKLVNSTANTTLVPGSVNISGAEGIVEIGDFAADMDTSTDQGIKLSGSGRLPAAMCTEVTGNVLSYGINVPQVGTRNNAIPGGIFRLDTRPSNQEFAVLAYTSGGNAEATILSVSLQTPYAAKILGSVNAASYTVGALFTANSTLVNAAAINVTGRVNTATFYATTSANVGANITVSTSSVLVSNGGATYVNVTATGITLANTTNTVTIVPPTTAQKGGNYYLKADGSWASVTASAAPGGSNTYVQYNDSDAMGGSAGFTFNETTNNVTIANTLTVAVINANGTIGTDGQVLKSNGTISYWGDDVTGEGNGTPGGSDTYIQYNDSGSFGGTAGFTFNETTNNVLIANTLTVGASGNTINSTVWTGKALTANNTDYLGGTAAADYQTEAGLSDNVATLTANNANYLGGTAAADYQTEAGLSANVATMTANNANYLGGTAAADYQTEAGLSANVATLAANNSTYLGGNIVANSTGAYPLSNTSGAVLGNTISRFILTGNSVSLSGDVSAAQHTSTNFAANSLGVYHSALVNSAAFTTTGFRANTTYVVPTSNSSGQNLGNTISRWILIGNTVTVSGGVYPDSNSLGTALGSATQRWILNANTITTSGLASLESLNVTNRTNTATFYATTSANVGANITISTASVLVSNGGATYVNVTATGITLANTTNTVTIIPPTTAQKGGNYYLKADGVWTEVVAGATPGGSNTHVQYNDSDALGGSAGFTFDETTNNVTIANTLIVDAINANGSLGSDGNVLKSNGTVAYWGTSTGGDTATRIYQAFTATDGQTAFVLTNTFANTCVDVYYNGIHLADTEYTPNSDANTITLDEGANTGAVVEVVAYSNAAVETLTFIPGGSNTHIQYNDSGTVAGSAGFIFNETTNNVTIANTLTIGTGTINTTNYTGTANNALYLGSLAAAEYANLSVATFTTSINVAANVQANLTTIRVGNTAVNTTIGNNVIYVGNSTSNATVNSTGVYVGTSAALLAATADQTIAGGARVTVLDLGNSGTGTITPDPGDRPMQKYTNNGAHTLAPGTNYGNYVLDILNTTGAGAITTSGWTKVSGDSFDTTTTSKFRCCAYITSDMSVLVVIKAA